MSELVPVEGGGALESGDLAESHELLEAFGGPAQEMPKPMASKPGSCHSTRRRRWRCGGA